MYFLSRFVVALSVTSLLVRTVDAHDLPVSDLKIVASAESMHVELVLNAAELNFFPEIDTNHDGLAGPGEIEAKSTQISKAIIDCFTFQVNGTVVQPAVHGLVPDLGSHHLTLRAHFPVDARETPVMLESGLAAITHGTHIVEVVLHRPSSRHAARLDAHDRDVLFDYKKKQVPVVKQSKQVATSSSPARQKSNPINYALILGLAALVGGFLFFRDTKK